MSRISTSARGELVAAVSDRYRSAQASEKRRILDEFVAVTGYHRKHAIRVLTTDSAMPAKRRTRKPRLYDEAVGLALVVLWEAADRICSKRLKPLLPILVPALERHGHLSLDPSVRSHLLKVSASTMDRMLAEPRAAAGGRRRASAAKPGVRRSIPIRTFADWNEPAPGYLEVDLVSHCGGTAAGSFTNTLVLTDIATGWTECVALLFRESTLVVDAVERLRPTMPFAILSIDTDNGGEFVNETMLAYCKSRGIEFTRARPHRKNDQAWVEQKNGSVVRRLVGYGRFEGTAAAEALARMYCASRLFVNFFQPSFKLAEKRRVGAKVVKRYHSPETPCARLLAHESIAEPMKERLRAVMAGPRSAASARRDPNGPAASRWVCSGQARACSSAARR